jgi:hypothetical protein
LPPVTGEEKEMRSKPPERLRRAKEIAVATMRYVVRGLTKIEKVARPLVTLLTLYHLLGGKTSP